MDLEEKIMKAFECHNVKHLKARKCALCPYRDEPSCVTVFYNDVFELLKKKNEHIKDLEYQIESLMK